MRSLLEITSTTEQTVSASALRSFCELAKIDHLIYKFRIYKVLFGITNEGEADFSPHTKCRLGKWYYEGEGRSYYSHLPGFKGIEPPHKRVHEAAIAALRAYSENNTEKMLIEVANMEQASLEVQECLELMANSGEDTPHLLKDCC
ncbi:CZB domain-containing protein [Pseudomonas sp. PH1b]|uniref:CZB domain-containing protein n=1 Tax=Pseudomonas sp. PH1b TaxID=1397282 RepID=UPI003526D5FA